MFQNPLNLKTLITLLLGIIPFALGYNYYEDDDDYYEKYYGSSDKKKEEKKEDNNKMSTETIYIIIIVFGLGGLILFFCIFCTCWDKLKNKDKKMTHVNNEEKEEKEASNNENINDSKVSEANIKSVRPPTLVPYLAAYYPSSGKIQPLVQVDSNSVPGIGVTPGVTAITPMVPGTVLGAVPGIAPIASPITSPVTSPIVPVAETTLTTMNETTLPIPMVKVEPSESTDIKKDY